MSTSLRDLVPIASAAAPPVGAQPASAGTSDPDGFAAALQSATAAATTTGGASAPQASTPTTSSSTTSARPTDEQLQAVPGALYAKIISGSESGMYLNEATGNPREGEAFRLEQRGDRALHIYGSGSDEMIEVIVHAASTTTTTSSSASGSTTESTTGATATGSAGTVSSSDDGGQTSS